jgi:hypothetical protein
MKERIYVEEELISNDVVVNPFGNSDPPYLIILEFKCNTGLDSYSGDGDSSGKPLIKDYLGTLGQNIKTFKNLASNPEYHTVFQVC